MTSIVCVYTMEVVVVINLITCMYQLLSFFLFQLSDEGEQDLTEE